MEPEQCHESRQMANQIVERLRCHAYIEGLSALHTFQYLVLPSFTPPIAWDVFCRRSKHRPDAYILTRTTWRSDVDLEKLRTRVERLRHPYPLVPTIEVHQLPSSSSDLRRLGEELAVIELPIGVPHAAFGVDGVTYEVAIESAFAARSRFSWWCEIPAAWSQLGVWVKRAETIFEAAWNGRDDAAPAQAYVEGMDIAAARLQAQRLFHDGHYGRAAELLAGVASREQLTLAEAKMLASALKRAPKPAAGSS